MKKALVTGCAGFIGSHLTERLLADGYHVTGVDGMVANYDTRVKLRNLISFVQHPRFVFVPSLLQANRWGEWLDGVEEVYHLAALPGVRSSWGHAFGDYAEHNLTVTQQLLEACVGRSHLNKIVVASSSSVYGTMRDGLTSEAAPFAPLSPYGVTKAAMEMLCQVYVSNHRLPVVILRYFTVYGPRQRPDMAFHRFIRHMLRKERIEIYGDGRQTRDFTFVSDAVEANLLAAIHGRPGEVYNIGGDREISLLEVIALIADLLGHDPQTVFLPEQPGDSRRTCADITRATERLGYRPSVTLKEGLRRQVADLTNQYQG